MSATGNGELRACVRRKAAGCRTGWAGLDRCADAAEYSSRVRKIEMELMLRGKSATSKFFAVAIAANREAA